MEEPFADWANSLASGHPDFPSDVSVLWVKYFVNDKLIHVSYLI